MPCFAVRKTAYHNVKHGILGCKMGHIEKQGALLG